MNPMCRDCVYNSDREACRICRQDAKRKDARGKPDTTHYGTFYVQKISIN